MALSPWQAPAPVITASPNALGNRTIGPSIGNAYGANNLGPTFPAFTPAVMSPIAKAQVIAAIDTMLSIWPYDYVVENGIVSLALRHQRDGIPQDPRVGAPPLDPIAVQADYEEGTVDQRYGGAPSWWIDWDRIDNQTATKLYQMWYNFKVAILAI